VIEIDGSYGEGGGSVLRQAVGLAAYSGRAVRITRIRAGRDEPGMKPQHVKAVEAAAAITGAHVEGAAVGSTELQFDPGPLRGGSYTFDVGTAGAATLVLQSLLLPCLCGEGEFDLAVVGGTDVPWSPPADYLASVTLSTLQRAGFGAGHLHILRRGYYPKGGGRLEARLVSGPGRAPVSLELAGGLEGVRGVSHAARILATRRVAERQADAARQVLTPLGVPVEITTQYGEAWSAGSGITLWTLARGGGAVGGSALGARGKPAEDVGREAAMRLREEIASGAGVDRHLADQLIPFLAVSGGSLVTSEVTSHTRSNIYVAERILGATFEVGERRVTARPVTGAPR
jgi:RNA 3'-terminal phosphate cyclase (GTP)